MVAGCADDFHAFILRENLINAAEVNLADSKKCAFSHAAVNINRFVTERVDCDGANRMRRLYLHFNHFCFHSINVLMHIAHIISIEYIKVSCQKNAFTDSKEINSLWHIIVKNTRKARCSASGNIFKLSADFRFDSFCNVNKFLKFICSRFDGTIAAEVRAYAAEYEVRHIVFHFNSNLCHFILVPKTFAEIAEVSHDNDLMLLSLFSGFLVQCF